MRKTKFQTGEYYHIYNRGVDKRKVFMDEKDYVRFLVCLKEFNQPDTIGSLRDLRRRKSEAWLLPAGRSQASDLVKIICYCLNPNHYHLLLKQTSDKGIEKFMHKIGTSYSKYFNVKHHRSGSLFQGTFKSISIKTDSYLLQLSCYINGNPEIHKISKAEKYKWSSYPDYLGKRKGTLCDKNVILKDFKDIDEYKGLVDAIIKESSQRKDDIKKYLLE